VLATLVMTPGKSKLVIDPFGHCGEAAPFFPSNARTNLFSDLERDLLTNSSVFSQNTKALTFYIMGGLEQNAPYVCCTHRMIYQASCVLISSSLISLCLFSGNYWTTLDDFPTPALTPVYLVAGGGLSFAPPTGNDSRTFIYDPRNPVPTTGGNNLLVALRTCIYEDACPFVSLRAYRCWQIICGPLDQQPVENRGDVLLFDSQILPGAVFVVGRVEVVLYISSNATDTDFTAKLTDVYPTGNSLLVQVEHKLCCVNNVLYCLGLTVCVSLHHVLSHRMASLVCDGATCQTRTLS